MDGFVRNTSPLSIDRVPIVVPIDIFFAILPDPAVKNPPLLRGSRLPLLL